MKVLIATPCAQNKCERNYTQSLLMEAFNAPDRLINLDKYDLAISLVGGVSGLGKERDILAAQALHMGFDKLMFIDADQSWTWSQLKTILDSDKPIVGGIVALKTYPIQLNFTPLDEDKKNYFMEERGFATWKGLHRMAAGHGGNVTEFEVKQMGTGFLCIDTKVLRAMTSICPSFKHAETRDGKEVAYECWDFFQSGVLDGVYHGEDWAFCTLAARCAYKTYINATIQIPHHGVHEYKPGLKLVPENYALEEFSFTKTAAPLIPPQEGEILGN